VQSDILGLRQRGKLPAARVIVNGRGETPSRRSLEAQDDPELRSRGDARPSSTRRQAGQVVRGPTPALNGVNPIEYPARRAAPDQHSPRRPHRRAAPRSLGPHRIGL